MLKCGDVLEHTERCSTLFFEPIGAGLHGENASGIFSIWGGFRTLSPYLEMSERAGRIQGVEKYCRNVTQWILRNGNSEIPPIIDVAAWISVISPVSLE